MLLLLENRISASYNMAIMYSDYSSKKIPQKHFATKLEGATKKRTFLWLPLDNCAPDRKRARQGLMSHFLHNTDQ